MYVCQGGAFSKREPLKINMLVVFQLCCCYCFFVLFLCNVEIHKQVIVAVVVVIVVVVVVLLRNHFAVACFFIDTFFF